MKVLFYFIIFYYASLGYAGERVQFVPIDIDKQNVVSEYEYQILKNDTRINELQLEIKELRIQLEKLDLMQAQMAAKLNGLLPKEDKFINSHLDNNEEEFKYGFDMLTAGNHDRAQRAFQLFIEKYPNDPKVGEAYFWMGELAYKIKDYKTASKHYLISYRDYKDSPRRNDSLFKLSIVLGFMGKKEESCAGFDILINDTPTITPNLRQKSMNEAINWGCRNNL